MFLGLQPVPLLLALLLSGHGYRKRSLSPSGALAALTVGYILLSPPLRSFGVTLITFYLAGSRATKFGKSRKAQLEEGHEEAGNRNAVQVLCNSFAAMIAAAFWCAVYAPDTAAHTLLRDYVTQSASVYRSESWCAVARDTDHETSRRLVFAALGHFGCCMGDTLASELGILARSRPILITTLKQVPPGTNGGVSAWGTICSILGGLFMGLTMAASLLAENTACRSDWTRLVAELALSGAFAGGAGSLLDSLLGATVQRTRYSPETKQVLQDHSAERRNLQRLGGLNMLTNNQVNLVSSVLMAGWLGMWA